MPRQTHFTVFIDEGGDPGVRDGIKYYDKVHEWFTLGALVVRTSREDEVVEWVREIRDKHGLSQGPALHYHKSAPEKRKSMCALLASKPARAFCYASHKSNMREYQNSRLGQMKAMEYYNWCTRLLLERVMEFAKIQSKKDEFEHIPLEIVFSKKGGHDYEHMFSFFEILNSQARLSEFTKKPKCWIPEMMDPDHWSVVADRERAGLQLADVVASAFLQAANTKSPRHDVAPAKALKRIISKDHKGQRANAGVTVWPLPYQATYPDEAKAIFRHFGYQ